MNEQRHFEKFKKRSRSLHRAAANADTESDGSRVSAGENNHVRVQLADQIDAAQAQDDNAAQNGAAKRRAVGRDTIF